MQMAFFEAKNPAVIRPGMRCPLYHPEYANAKYTRLFSSSNAARFSARKGSKETLASPDADPPSERYARPL